MSICVYYKLMQKGFTPVPIILGIVVILGIIGGAYYLGLVKNKSIDSKPSQTSNLPTSTSTNLPASDNQVSGDITWLEQPIKISQTGSLLVFPTTVPSSSPNNQSQQITGLPSFYKVGSWTSGEYKGQDVIDIQFTFPGQSGNYHEIKYATYKDGKIVLFNTMPDQLGSYLDPKTQVSDILLDQRHIPNILLTNTNNKFPVAFQGKNLTFTVYQSGEFFSKSDYVLLTSFANGQKLYRKNQTSNSIPWSNLENVYKGTDFDQTELNVSDETGSNISSYDKISKNWLVQPDLLSDLSPESKSLNDIGYSNYFEIGCQLIPIESLAGNTTFNPSDLKLVMTAGEISYYQPTNADQLLRKMYDLIKDAEAKDTTLKAPSYDRFIKSLPLLIWKDSFGTYQLTFRWRDYPGREGGCGKPVIYLYPKVETQVEVSFVDKMSLTASEPKYGNGWRVLARPNGELTDLKTNLNYPNLYWEGATINPLPQKNEGFIVKKEEVKTFLEDSLKTLGLNTQEKQDFINFWLPKMQEKPFYKISFYTTEEINAAIPLNINPEPDTIFRVLMKYQGLDKSVSIQPQVLSKPFNRNGFTVVEWGGIFSN